MGADILVKLRDEGDWKRGYVVDIKPTGWGWGSGEIGGGEFGLVRCLDAPPDFLSAFMESERGHGEDNRVLQMRGFYLELENLIPLNGTLTYVSCSFEHLMAYQRRVMPRFKE